MPRSRGRTGDRGGGGSRVGRSSPRIRLNWKAPGHRRRISNIACTPSGKPAKLRIERVDVPFFPLMGRLDASSWTTLKLDVAGFSSAIAGRVAGVIVLVTPVCIGTGNRGHEYDDPSHPALQSSRVYSSGSLNRSFLPQAGSGPGGECAVRWTKARSRKHAMTDPDRQASETSP